MKKLFAVIAVLALGATFAPAASADTVGPISFESYATGPIWGQQGWTPASTPSCGPLDIAVSQNSDFPAAPASFGAKSYRISNASTTGCFNDSFSPQTINAAGESTAADDGWSGGTRQPMFTAEFSIASSTGALQPGLNIQVSPDRGDGARMSYLRARHTGSALEFEFIDVNGVTGTAPCFQCANFRSTTLGPYDATKTHTVKLVMRLLEGPSNDVVQVFIDGVLVHTGTSWEDYYRLDTESSPGPIRVSRTADSLLIRASGTPAPSTAGQGFLIDGLSVTTGPLTPYKATVLNADPIVLKLNPLTLSVLVGLNARLTSGGLPVAGQPVTFSAGATILCTGLTNANGDANCAKLLSVGQLTALLSLGYRATYAGDSTYLPSTGTAGLLG
jgi:hypothetical protein